MIGKARKGGTQGRCRYTNGGSPQRREGVRGGRDARPRPARCRSPFLAARWSPLWVRQVRKDDAPELPSGLDEFDGGEVLIGGESISGMSDRRRTRFRAERMGFIFQTYNLIPVLSAVENVELPLLVAGTRPKEARRRATAALEMVGVPEQAGKRPNEMSGGQQQRVTVARSLVNDPAIVWADEPTGALDSETSGEIVDLLVRLNREQGHTFVLVTHDASVAARAHRTIRMRDGLIEGDEPNGNGGRDG